MKAAYSGTENASLPSEVVVFPFLYFRINVLYSEISYLSDLCGFENMSMG